MQLMKVFFLGSAYILGTVLALPNPAFIATSNSTSLESGAKGQCVDDLLAWQAVTWHSSDCSAAIHQLFVDDVLKHRTEVFELVSRLPGGWPSRQLPYLYAPKRYTFGKQYHCPPAISHQCLRVRAVPKKANVTGLLCCST